MRVPLRYYSVWELLTLALDLVGLFVYMYVSELLVGNILFGGAVYLLGDVWVTYLRLYNKRSMHLLPSSIQRKGMLVFVLAAALTLLLVFWYPALQSAPTAVALVLLIGMFMLQQMATDTIARRGGGTDRRRAWLLAGVYAAFLAGYVALFYVNRLIVGYPVPEGIVGAYVALICLDVLLYVCQYGESRRPGAARGAAESPGINADRLMDVHAYRVYNNMAVNTLFAINLALFSFICYMRFLPYRGFGASVAMLLAWMGLIGLVTSLWLQLLRRRYVERYDRHVIVFVGLVLWLMAALRILGGERSTTLASVVNACLMGGSMACLLSILLQQGSEMKAVIELGIGEIDQAAYIRNTGAMLDWSRLLAMLLLVAMLTVASFPMEGRLGELEATRDMRRAFELIMLVLPLVAIVASLIYSMRQPLDRQYARKLQKYRELQLAGEPSPPLEERLRKILVANHPKRLALLVLKPLARPFLPCRVVGRERVDVARGPVIFVCNHMEVYGPIIAVLHSPFPFRPWVIQDMLDEDVIVGHMGSGIEKVHVPRALRGWVARRVAPLVLWIMGAMDPIPVYRGTVRGVIETIQQSVEAMEYDDNILLFPEIDYQPSGVGDFFTGFVQVAKSYHKKTGRRAMFYPMYINKKGHTMTYGEGIRYDPDNSAGLEKDRIVEFLKKSMNEMAGG